MNPMLKMALEIGPLAVFFITYRMADGDMMLATAAFIPTILASLAVSMWITRRVPRMMLVTAVVVVIFGGLTLWLNDATFIKMKPTVIYGLFALGLTFGILRGQNYLRLLLEESLQIDARGWHRMTVRWVWFFVAMAVVNEAVWRTQSEAVWVNVKTFGYLPAALAFGAAQVPMLRRHWLPEGQPADPGTAPVADRSGPPDGESGSR